MVLVLGLRFWSPVAFSLALAFPATEGWPVARSRDPVRDEVRIPAAGATLTADLYRPAKPRASLLLVHGLSRAGGRHPELVRLARLLAGHGTLVLVPHFESLAAFRLSGREVEEIAAALHYLGRVAGPVGIAGFSFGAGPALVAAAGVPDLRLVGSFGGYADLRHVVAFLTTGVHAFGDRRWVERQEAYNRWKLLALLVPFVTDARDRDRLASIAEAKLASPSAEPPTASLGAEGQSVLALVLNDREAAVAPLLAGLPRGARDAIDRLSPLPLVARLPGRVLIAHGIADDSIPFTESLRLAEAAGGRARLAILRTFQHTGPGSFWASLGDRARDGASLFLLADDLLAGR
ncbi:MAG: hypothetical protein HY727_09905 [Candidatus Rokubacteria bacterium]|nr:hypothetical protein [Candidatus Rokubacteria bacterium]